MFEMRAIGFVASPYTETSQIPKGCGASHEAEGVLEILPELEQGLTDIEGFSHLFVIWVFHQTEGFSLLGKPPTDDRPHGVFATRSPYRPNPIGLTVVQLIRREGLRLHVRGVDMLNGTRSSISSHISPVFRKRSSDEAGWRKQRRGDKNNSHGGNIDANTTESTGPGGYLSCAGIPCDKRSAGRTSTPRDRREDRQSQIRCFVLGSVAAKIQPRGGLAAFVRVRRG